ncbi:MAG: lactonase family protein [Bythopirellula sp.]
MIKLYLYSCMLLLAVIWKPANAATDQILFVGTSAKQDGIFVCTMNLQTGAFSPARAVGDASQPTFLALHPKMPVLYAVTKEKEAPSGGVRAFHMDLSAPSLTLINRQSTADEGATHLALDPAGKAIVVANYSGGSTALLAIGDYGDVKAHSMLIEHEGSSIDPNRQQAPHAHGVAFDSQGRFACVADLGTDEVIVYRLAAGKLTRKNVWNAKPGAGPRHLAFHPNGRWLYCINELDSTLSTLILDESTGALSELQTIGTLPADFASPNTTAEVVVHPSGKFVYISNRGHDSTAAFAIDAQSGQLSLIEIEPTGGGHPRFIGIEPSGRYLIAANRDGNNLVSFQIDPATGTLTPTGHELSIPRPMCVVFPVP